MDAIDEPDEQQPLLARRSNQVPPAIQVDSEDMDKDIEIRKEPVGVIATASIDEINAEARTATDKEHRHSFWEAVRLYPAAVGWSLFFSLGVIMCAFDPQLLGQLYATPAFQRDFGYLYDGSYIVSAPWQTGLSMGSPIGQVVGAFFAAYPMEWFGRKKTFGACVILTTGFVFIQFFARSLPVLLAGELLGGLVLGSYAVIAPAAPFAIQWLWPLVILIGLPFAPESPWWLQRQGRFEDAEKSLKRLASPKVDVRPTLAMIIETDRLEREIEAGSTYSDCFKKINIRRTEIAVGVYTIQVLSGIYLVGYATYFFTLAGLPSDQAFNMGVGFLAIGFVGTCLSWILLIYFGRRTIYNTGLALLAVLQIIIGILDCAPHYDSRPSISWAQSVLMLIWNFIYDLSIGPVCFVLLCEVSATRVRGKTIAIATAVQATAGIVMTVAIPYMINPDQADMRGKLGFFFGGLAALCLTWSYFRVPELKGRTYQEVDIMFERNIKTKDFKHYVVTA
ncbi:hypothetical protein CLAIMM_13407 [Cladophialophora immunda]|nr:hypothetical protein CLAIMM_13407 [Cladophialophora immunda]